MNKLLKRNATMRVTPYKKSNHEANIELTSPQKQAHKRVKFNIDEESGIRDNKTDATQSKLRYQDSTLRASQVDPLISLIEHDEDQPKLTNVKDSDD